MLSSSLPDSGLPVPIKIRTDGDFAILINQLPICDFSQHVILCSQPINMDLHFIKNVKSPVNKCDAVNKAYVYRIKYKTTTVIIPNIAIIDNIPFTFFAATAFSSGNIIICEM